MKFVKFCKPSQWTHEFQKRIHAQVAEHGFLAKNEVASPLASSIPNEIPEGSSHEPDLYTYMTRGRKRAKVLTRKEENTLTLRIAEGDDAAFMEFVERNIGLVVAIANGCQGFGLDLPDLIQEGVLGLMRAVKRFRPNEHGTKFSTYGAWWIRQSIMRAIANYAKDIRLPVYKQALLLRFSRAYDELFARQDGEVRDADLGRALTLSPEKITALKELLELRKPLRLDAPLGDGSTIGGGSYVKDVVPDVTAEDPSNAFDVHQLESRIGHVLQSLSEIERAIIKARFGLFGTDEMTLEALARRYGVSRERIRQIEGKALRTLRHPKRKRYLSEFGFDRESTCDGSVMGGTAELPVSLCCLPAGLSSARLFMDAVAQFFSVTYSDIRLSSPRPRPRRVRMITAHILTRDGNFSRKQVAAILSTTTVTASKYLRVVSNSFTNGNEYAADIAGIRALLQKPM
ncbi:MAG: RNA polymerase primary sigma factor [Parcubacteria group bacterium Gr01-1014_72]|nr:MAG: RNA polymerase primary sigma factor [Parcubacteria group bacterium Gr01-1014_72]